jgi:hypothetical protein
MPKARWMAVSWVVVKLARRSGGTRARKRAMKASLGELDAGVNSLATFARQTLPDG